MFLSQGRRTPVFTVPPLLVVFTPGTQHSFTSTFSPHTSEVNLFFLRVLIN